LSDERKKEIYRDVRFFHGAIQIYLSLLLYVSYMKVDKLLTGLLQDLDTMFPKFHQIRIFALQWKQSCNKSRETATEFN